MPEIKNHIIHLVDGQLHPRSTTTRDEVTSIIDRALTANTPKGLVLHFHGGLVSEQSGLNIATRLQQIYEPTGVYPVFFVWESGLVEAVTNNLTDISKEKLFREFVKKVGEWVLKKLPQGIGFKGVSGTSINEIKLRKEFDEWFEGNREAPPVEFEPEQGIHDGTVASRLKGSAVDKLSLEADVQASIESDPDFQNAVQTVYNGLYPSTSTTRGTGSTAAATSNISADAADELFTYSPSVTKGLTITWWKVAKFVAKITLAVIKRYADGRGHGLYETTVEEVIRALFPLEKLGKLIWGQMKKDTNDAFLPGEIHGGTAVLDELSRRQQMGMELPKITLIGHSTGAIYICNFLASASQKLPEKQFDVIFLAPAVTYEKFDETQSTYGNLIANFRAFGMNDDWEREDKLVPYVYTNSLLYFVSGVLEPDIDQPLIGMERFLREQDVFTPAEFPEIKHCREFYSRYTNSLIWSPASTAPPGQQSMSRKHGDFDNDEETLESVQWILQNGF